MANFKNYFFEVYLNNDNPEEESIIWVELSWAVP